MLVFAIGILQQDSLDALIGGIALLQQWQHAHHHARIPWLKRRKGLCGHAKLTHRSFITRQLLLIHQTGERRSEEHTSELQSLMRISYAVFCLKKTPTNKLQY